MSQDVTWLGNNYTSVPFVTLPKTGGGTALFSDPSGVTATAADVASGKYFLDQNGELKQGTASGGGGSNWELLASQEFSAKTTSTTQSTLGNISLGSLPSGNYILWIHVRDKAGARSGYFYGTDTFFFVNNGSRPDNANPPGYTIRYTGSAYSVSSSVRGVYPYSINQSNAVVLYQRYASSTSGTINGTYKCDVYKLTTPSGFTIFT